MPATHRQRETDTGGLDAQYGAATDVLLLEVLHQLAPLRRVRAAINADEVHVCPARASMGNMTCQLAAKCKADGNYLSGTTGRLDCSRQPPAVQRSTRPAMLYETVDAACMTWLQGTRALQDCDCAGDMFIM